MKRQGLTEAWLINIGTNQTTKNLPSHSIGFYFEAIVGHWDFKAEWHSYNVKDHADSGILAEL